MRLAAVGALLSLALFGALSLLLSLLAAALWRLGHRRFAAGQPGALLALRLGPAMLSGAAVLGVFVPAFLLHEPWHSDEHTGLGLGLAAALGAALVARGAFCGFTALRASAALRSRWRREGRPIELRAGIPSWCVELGFPVACVIGLRRHELFVARCVVETLDPEELELLLAHERRHAERCDNLRALLVRAAPDVLSLLPAGRELERVLFQAVEQKADAESAAGSRERSLLLASALVRVAQLQAAEAPALLPASFLHEASIDERIRRLLAARSAPAGLSAERLLAGSALLAAAALWLAAPPLGRVHAAAEALVALLG